MRPRWIELLRAAYGLVLLAAPEPLLDHGGLGDDRRARAVVRVLGGRQVTQGLVSGLRPSKHVLVLGGCVDALHAASMFGLAAADRRRARAALVEAMVASTWCVLGLRAARRRARGGPTSAARASRSRGR